MMIWPPPVGNESPEKLMDSVEPVSEVDAGDRGCWIKMVARKHRKDRSVEGRGAKPGWHNNSNRQMIGEEGESRPVRQSNIRHRRRRAAASHNIDSRSGATAQQRFKEARAPIRL